MPREYLPLLRIFSGWAGYDESNPETRTSGLTPLRKTTPRSPANADGCMVIKVSIVYASLCINARLPTHVGLVLAEKHGPFEDQLYLVPRVSGGDVNSSPFSSVVEVALPVAYLRYLFAHVSDEAGRGLEGHLPAHHLDPTSAVVVVLQSGWKKRAVDNKPRTIDQPVPWGVYDRAPTGSDP